MINSRDSYTDFNPNKKENIQVPYGIGTIIELKDNPEVLAKICQYRVTVEKFRLIVYVGLNTSICEEEFEIDCEITAEELEEKWRKPNRIIIGKLDKVKKLKLTSKKNKNNLS